MPVKRLKVTDVMEQYRDGDEHGWPQEFDWLRQNSAHKLRTLARSVLNVGITRPILLGNDGRVWDGHHRIYIAHHLGITEIPVEHARDR